LRVSKPLVATDNGGLARELLLGITQKANWSERNVHEEAEDYQAD
jgi:hypothetical protein